MQRIALDTSVPRVKLSSGVLAMYLKHDVLQNYKNSTKKHDVVSELSLSKSHKAAYYCNTIIVEYLVILKPYICSRAMY